MKVWASASAIGLSMAYFAVACSSDPPDDPGYVQPTAGSPGAGAPATAGASGAAGAATAGAPGGGAPPTDAGAGGATAGGTAAGAGGAPMMGTCPTGVDGHCDAGATYPTYAGYTLKLVEDFPAPLDLNTDPIWTWSDGAPQDGQTNFGEDNITFANGKMIIKAEVGAGANCTPKAASTCYPPRPSYGEAFSDVPTPRQIEATGVKSGELRTRYNNYRYGRFEVKYKSPNMPAGNYLSTMFVFRTPKDVDWNEIDVELSPNKPMKVQGNIVNPWTSGGQKNYPGGGAWDADVAGLVQHEDHIYAFTWTPDAINWYVDNSTTPVKTWTKAQGVNGDPNKPDIPNLATKIMMNLWVFKLATAFGDPSKNVFPMQAEYDWFRYYQLDTEKMYPCSPTPACLNKTNGDYTAASQNNPKESPYVK